MVKALNETETAKQLGKLQGWSLWGLKKSHIRRDFKFNDFRDAIHFVNAVAALADKADHHPDIVIRCNEVSLTLSTHSAGGLTPKDFALAHEIDLSVLPLSQAS